jgi:phage gp36-like protein
MLLTADLKTHLYGEQITVISRNDSDLMDSAINAAEGEAKGYLSRYDIAVIFAKTGATRDETLLMFLKDIATWNFITLANANADMDFRESRYKQAVAWLKGVQAGKIVPFGWPLISSETTNSLFHVTSDAKRLTNY